MSALACSPSTHSKTVPARAGILVERQRGRCGDRVDDLGWRSWSTPRLRCQLLRGRKQRGVLFRRPEVLVAFARFAHADGGGHGPRKLTAPSVRSPGR